jgi:hypothetical protein|tara:strand:- start:707 stop:988 length:282 start_codon:yes stop_codon:yes gene_type:complete
MKPTQHAEQAALILKDRAEKLGDYRTLYENIATRANLSLGDKIAPGKKITAADITKILVEMKLARMDCGKPDSDHIWDAANYLFLFGGLTDEK